MPLIYALFKFDVFLLHLSTFSRFSAALTAGYPSASSSLLYDINKLSLLADVHLWKLSALLHKQMRKPTALIGRGAGTSLHLPREVR